MPIDYKKYPSNWKSEIRPMILQRARGSCECCGVAHHAVGYRDKDGDFHKTRGNIYHDLAGDGLHYPSLSCLPYSEAKDFVKTLNEEMEHRKYIVIVLTIAHLDHDISNNCPTNLKALCQKCHLSHDAEHHKKNAQQTIKTKKGLLELQF